MSNELVLIVEDEFAIAELLEMALIDGGFRVVMAANGRQGLQCLAQGPLPDLVIADFMMPVLDGPGLLRAIRETEAFEGVEALLSGLAREAAAGRTAALVRPEGSGAEVSADPLGPSG